MGKRWPSVFTGGGGIRKMNSEAVTGPVAKRVELLPPVCSVCRT